MNASINRFRSLIALLTLSTVVSTAFADDNELGDPIITFHSNAFWEVGVGNQFSLFISGNETSTYLFDMGDYDIEYEVEPGSVDPDEGTWVGTWIPVSVNEGGMVRIYGDAANLNVISIDGGYLTSIDMDACVNLEVISLQHNSLQDLDLSPFSSLYALYLSDNPFTGSKSLYVGPNKPELAILEMDIIQNIAPGFNLSDYPAMRSFDGYYNLGLTSIDTSGCPELLSLSLEMTAVDKLDVSHNTKLRSLNISESRITDIDVTMLPDLRIFIAGHDSGWVNKGYRLNSIDLTHNPELYFLSIAGNHLGSLDLSGNPLLSHLMAGRNDLREIDLSNNSELYSVSLVFNDLDFATLPMPTASWGEYWYMQNNLAMPRSLAKGTEVDMSSRVLRAGTLTDGTLWASPIGTDDYPLDDSYYTYADGKFTILDLPTDSVYMKFSNNVFYEYPLTTSKFMVKEPSEMGKPSLILKMNVNPSDPTLRFAVGMDGATPETPKKFLVELATDVFTEFETTFHSTPTGFNVEIPMPADFNGNVGIYIPEGEVMTSFSADGQALNAIDLTAATELNYLSLNDCGLYGVNLAYNRCLRYLDVSSNNLTELNLQGVYGNYAKNVLSTVKAAHNNISSYGNFKFNDTATFRHLDLSYNKLDNFKLLEFENLEYVDLSHNNLCEELYITYQNSAKHIDLSYNELPSVVIDSFEDLDLLDLTHNVITLSAMPLPTEIGNCHNYVYAPQQVYELPLKAPAVDLSDQNRVVKGVGTTFTWLTTDGTPLEQGVDVDCVGGVTRFLKADLGNVYCVMTNPAFPLFEGENAYRTSEVTPMTYPTVLVASFTTSTNSNTGDVTFTGSRKTELYIDWRGDGTEFVSYPVKTSYINYPGQTTYAGAEVKVYTYDRADLITVFSVTGIPMSEADLTPLTKATCINLSGSGLSEDEVKLPDAPVREFSMASCSLNSFPWTEKYASTLCYLNLANNNISSFDASALPKLQTLTLSNNSLTDIHFDNPSLWGVAVLGNSLTSIDLSGLPWLDQIDLSDNMLSTIDITPVESCIKVLMLPGNQFTFATLPIVDNCPMLGYFTYGYQADLEIDSADGKVDLSSVAYALNGEASTFTWYLGVPEWDSTNYVWVGEVLEEDVDYTVADGVTTFLHPLDDQVMCMVNNPQFPQLTLYTNMVSVVVDGVKSILADGADKLVDVYTTTGILVRSNVAAADATIGLLPGCYIVGNRKVFVK